MACDGDFERQKEVNLPTNSCEFVRNCRSRLQHGASCLTSKVRKMEPRLVIGLETNSRAYSSSAGQNGISEQNLTKLAIYSRVRVLWEVGR